MLIVFSLIDKGLMSIISIKLIIFSMLNCEGQDLSCEIVKV